MVTIPQIVKQGRAWSAAIDKAIQARADRQQKLEEEVAELEEQKDILESAKLDLEMILEGLEGEGTDD